MEIVFGVKFVWRGKEKRIEYEISTYTYTKHVVNESESAIKREREIDREYVPHIINWIVEWGVFLHSSLSRFNLLHEIKWNARNVLFYSKYLSTRFITWFNCKKKLLVFWTRFLHPFFFLILSSIKQTYFLTKFRCACILISTVHKSVMNTVYSVKITYSFLLHFFFFFIM